MSPPRPSKVVVSASILICLVLAYYISTHLRDFGGKAAITPEERIVTRQEWPQTFIDLLNNAKRRHIKVDTIRVYQMPYGEYYWVSETSPELLDLMTFCWKLTAVSSKSKVVEFALERMPVALSLDKGKDTDYYVSAEYLPGGAGTGHLYCVMNDKAGGIIVARYYYNF